MKKLLLLPVLLMTMLVGCNDKKPQETEKETIYTPMDWFKDTDVIENDLKFYSDFYEIRDYGKVVEERMMRLFDIDFRHPKKITKVDTNDLFTYKIKKDMGPYTDYTIYVHEKCVETIAYSRVNNNDIKQCARYETYSASGAALLVAFASKRGDEIHKIQEEEYNAAEEVATLENFYQGIEESTTNPIATFSNVTREDTGHALLDDFKDLFNGHNEKAYGANKDYAFMTYGLNDNFMLRFYLDRTEDCIAILEYKYQCSLGYTSSVTTGYKVNREKVDNIIKKITIPAN